MKKVLVWLLFVSFVNFNLAAQKIVLEGVYQGQDVYVKNPFSENAVGFCAYEVLVNGEITSDEVNSNAFIIDLAAFNLKENTPLLIEILCKDDCGVSIINPEAIQPRSSFEIVSLALEANGKLQWETDKETGNQPFIIEQLKWNKWVEIGKVRGSGNGGKNKYVYTIPLHYGKNTLRLKRKDHQGVRYSESVSVTSQKSQPVTVKRTRVIHKIEFSADTYFEVYSEFGELVTTGFGNHFSVAHLPRGKYFLNYGNQFGESIAKR